MILNDINNKRLCHYFNQYVKRRQVVCVHNTCERTDEINASTDYVTYLIELACTIHVNLFYYLVRNDMDVNEHERLSNITLRHKLK